ncbi:MAG TPA: YihY family inner membrane protein [Candidatus Cybelea sp.]|nr:YihY family inner membrane protein [Candidatus Cybelea sp.]
MVVGRRHFGLAGEALALVRYTVRRFFADRCMQVAGALSFTTLLAAVPVAAVLIAIVSTFPFAQPVRHGMERHVLTSFVPEVGKTVAKYLDRFVVNAGNLTTLGIIGLAVIALAALITIQGSFDQIWRVRATRARPLRILAFVVALCFGPILFGFALAVPAYGLALATAVGIGDYAALAHKSVFLLPPTAEVVGLMSMYMILPHARVRLLDALAGAAVAALLIELAKYGFARYVAGFANYDVTYGALSVLPVLLVWIYLAWSAVLFGAVVAASMPVWRRAMQRFSRG